MRFIRILAFLPLLLAGLAPSAAWGATSQAMLFPHGATTRILPFLDYHQEESPSVDIEEIASLGQNGVFKPLALSSLPRQEGIVWLRFTLAPLQRETPPGTYLLDMGQSVPGRPTLYVPTRNELSGAMEWRENTPAQRNILLMPEQARGPLTCYIRLEGQPGPWFDPVIRTPHDVATSWSGLFHTGSTLTLAVVMLLCLLRGLNENGQWRIWTGFFVFFAFLQNLLGMPAYGQGFSISQLTAAMAPGLSLMTLPHAGRHLLKTGQYSRNLDIQLLLLSVLGGIVALAPLVPGFSWLDRLVDAWPILVALLLPTALAIWMKGIPGARAFLLACLMPPLFTLAAWVGLGFSFSPALLAALPSWGVSLCALILIAIPANTASAHKENPFEKKTKPRANSLPDDIINLENPLDDPNLRILSASPQEKLEISDHTPYVPPPAANYPKAVSSKETALRQELDSLLRETAGLGQCALPPASRLYAENIIKSAEKLAKVLTDPDYRESAETEPESASETFNLQSVIRGVHDAAAPIAEHAGLSLSWYMPPYIPQEYQGDAGQLSHVLSLLVDSAIRGTSRGNIKLGVRRVPESQDQGHLLFTISDTGDGAPPLHRSSVALAKTWEFATRHNGFLGMESGPGGLSIAFSAHFAMDNEEIKPQKRKVDVLVAGTDQGSRGELAALVEEIPYGVMEVNSIEDALARQENEAVSLLVASDGEARPAIGDLVGEFVKKGKEAGFSAIYILAITPDESQWGLLKTSGFTHAMTEPIDAEAFKYTVSKLLTSVTRAEPGKDEDKTSPDTPEEDRQTNSQRKAPDTAEEIIDLMDSFYSHSSSIVASQQPLRPEIKSRRPADTDNEKPAPQMLDEQEFDLTQTFEGPEWLNSSHEQEDVVTREAEEPETEVVAAETSDDAESMPASPPDEAKREYANMDDGVWIGEPTPIASTMHEPPAAPEPSFQNASEEAAREAKPDEALEEQDPHASVMDLIVSVNEAEEREAPAEETAAESAEQPIEERREFHSKDVMAKMLTKLDNNLKIAREAYAQKDCALVEEATAAMAREAEDHGCRIVGRLARCVERAARAKDVPALGDLLPVLADAVERNRIASTPRG